MRELASLYLLVSLSLRVKEITPPVPDANLYKRPSPELEETISGGLRLMEVRFDH